MIWKKGIGMMRDMGYRIRVAELPPSLYELPPSHFVLRRTRRWTGAGFVIT